MSLKAQIDNDIKQAMLARNKEELEALVDRLKSLPGLESVDRFEPEENK